MTKVTISLAGHHLTADFNTSDTATALMNRMPLAVEMMNLYAREMTYRFPEALPARKAKTSGYEAGDIGYWKPRHSFVIFYKQTGEVIDQLQIVGHIVDDAQVFEAVGRATVAFQLAE